MQVTIDVSKHQMDILAGLFKEMKIRFDIDTLAAYEEVVERNMVKVIKMESKGKMLGIKKTKELMNKYLNS